MSTFYITGDTHGDFRRISTFIKNVQATDADTMIVLGDAGLNYYQDWRDAKLKKFCRTFPIQLFCIHGNHEIRPQNIETYTEGIFHGGKVLFEERYPNILFAIDGEVYDFDGLKCLVIGGAYSVDKHYRLMQGFGWWPDEQPSEEIKARVEARLQELDYKVDVVLSHTSPEKYEPIEVFLAVIDQATVDKSTERWLDTIEERLTYQKWYCGHYHTSKRIDKIQFMFNDYDVLRVDREG